MSCPGFALDPCRALSGAGTTIATESSAMSGCCLIVRSQVTDGMPAESVGREEVLGWSFPMQFLVFVFDLATVRRRDDHATNLEIALSRQQRILLKRQQTRPARLSQRDFTPRDPPISGPSTSCGMCACWVGVAINTTRDLRAAELAGNATKHRSLAIFHAATQATVRQQWCSRHRLEHKAQSRRGPD